MSRTGAIVIVEDDNDDKILFEDVVRELGYENKIICFDNADSAYDYLLQSHNTFMIFSDIVLQGKSGLELKIQIDNTPELRRKSIPFVFYSTWAHEKDINEAYMNMTVQGFFKKSNSYDEMKEMISLILNYWKECQNPNLG